ncbi:MAG: hypothetical protein EZS28_000078 [Streblomastix strix]|uniref:Uncharacterized protein n=1 Tax=Streblomastix strix TaxID=222440 RepID=A0A5J4XAR5_9EUKA|nr:MAG: hypothetical protein EZS28_000078 [Streblomastix strix]
MHLQQLGTIEATLKGNYVNAFRNDGEHYYSIKEIKPESKMPALFDKEILILKANVQFDNKIIDGTLQNDSTTEQFIYSTVKPRYCGTYITKIGIEYAIKDPVSILYATPIRFRLSIPIEDIIIFSVISLAKYYTINKTDLMANGPDKLKIIDLLFRNWSLGYQYTKQFSQMGCTADLITKISLEQITDSGLKNLICSISPLTLLIKNFVVTEVTANMSGYKAIDDCLQGVRDFFENRPFVVPAQRVEAWSFPTKTQLVMKIHISQHVSYNLSQKFSRHAYDNLDLLFEATDEFEDALTTSRNTASRRLNPHTDLTQFMISLQCERNSNGALTFDGLDTNNQNVSVELRVAPIYQGDTDCYYNVDIMSKIPPPPILCAFYDTFWLFGPVNGGSCVYDVYNMFDEVISQIER